MGFVSIILISSEILTRIDSAKYEILTRIDSDFLNVQCNVPFYAYQRPDMLRFMLISVTKT